MSEVEDGDIPFGKALVDKSGQNVWMNDLCF